MGRAGTGDVLQQTPSGLPPLLQLHRYRVRHAYRSTARLHPAFAALSETSLLLECLTRDHGRVGMVARGVRRARARVSLSTLQAFQSLTLAFSLRGELGTLRTAES